MDEEPKRLVVRRYDPPPESDEPPRPVLRAKLTPEEARALVAVATVPKGPWENVKLRLRRAFFVTTLASFAIYMTIGHSWIVEIALFFGAIGWVAWPLVFARRDDWA